MVHVRSPVCTCTQLEYTSYCLGLSRVLSRHVCEVELMSTQVTSVLGEALGDSGGPRRRPYPVRTSLRFPSHQSQHTRPHRPIGADAPSCRRRAALRRVAFPRATTPHAARCLLFWRGYRASIALSDPLPARQSAGRIGQGQTTAALPLRPARPDPEPARANEGGRRRVESPPAADSARRPLPRREVIR